MSAAPSLNATKGAASIATAKAVNAVNDLKHQDNAAVLPASI